MVQLITCECNLRSKLCLRLNRKLLWLPLLLLHRLYQSLFLQNLRRKSLDLTMKSKKILLTIVKVATML
ncbi:hypothetical protein scyTo_0003050 [Scyliorhinus torazame]|uniref:Uncharacterized protein n=1 Tax=Scyliorhinus torazame TaxID=75743 RepID=A0A401PLG4_SCYTO|nr:hypothetical protein [Scyliorhinus torazame]